jgi:hypothetical protein
MKRKIFGPKYVDAPQISAGEANVAEVPFLLEEQILNIEKYLIHRAGTRRTTVYGLYVCM